jgi:hypothetical protein
MQRTTIMLPVDLKQRASTLATRLGISLGELIRQSLEAALRGNAGEVREDPLFTDQAVYRGPVPANLSADHDDFLYGEARARDR